MLTWLSLLIGQQILTRSTTFILNVAITRYLPIEQFGATMTLTLLESTVLFICREPVRRIVIRNGTGDYVQGCINCSWLISLPGSILLTFLILNFRTSDINADTCLLLYCSGIIIDMMTEPFYLATCALGRIPTRIAVESISSVLKIVFTFILIMPPFSMGFLAYGWAQLSYSVVKLLMFAIDSQKSCLGLPLPRRGQTGQWIERQVFDLGGNFALHSVEKYLLTEGENLALVVVARDHHAQGVYAMVQNLGSLIARFIFQPVEEIASLFFSKEHESTANLRNTVCILIKLMLMLGLLGVSFGPPYSFIVIHVLYGPAWSKGTDSPHVLSLYCFYILFLALNGITEAFTFSTISSDQLKVYNSWILIPLSLTHTLLSFSLVSFGNGGLILVNCISMGLRIFYSLHFIKNKFFLNWNNLIRSVLPDKIILLILFASSLCLKASVKKFQVEENPSAINMFAHIFFGCFLLSIILPTIWIRERNSVRECIEISRTKIN